MLVQARVLNCLVLHKERKGGVLQSELLYHLICLYALDVTRWLELVGHCQTSVRYGANYGGKGGGG